MAKIEDKFTLRDDEYHKFLMYNDEDYGKVYSCVDKETGEDFTLQIKPDGTKRKVPKINWNNMKGDGENPCKTCDFYKKYHGKKLFNCPVCFPRDEYLKKLKEI